MSGREGADVFRWETYRSGTKTASDRSTTTVVVLAHVLLIGPVLLAEPWAGLVIGGALGLFWGALLIPPRLRERAAVEWAEIRPGPPGVLVLARANGAETHLPLDSVSRLGLFRVGYRSADNPDGGNRVLELRAGRRTYRTRATFNPPPNDPELLAEALRRACPDAEVTAYRNRTQWVSESE
ncbi:hypothetical protein ACIRBX_22605 [Kitasatospora sp. NPDC096147]|uniref:hypothetical protein n=1 Tax=Kitasatospora sp. NPDC096147 TaxID=3364093 RepID=UPI0038065BC2